MIKRNLLLFATSLCFCNIQAQPQFSHPHGLYDQPVNIALTPTTPGAAIYYTNDGSTPTTASLRYSKPIAIDKSTIIRAIEVTPDSTSAVSTATYIYPESVINQSNNQDGYPDTWGPFCEIPGDAPAWYGMYHGFDNFEDLKPFMEQGLRDLPILSLVSDRDNFFGKERDEQKGGIYIYTGTPVGDPIGKGWERPVSIELIGGPQKHNLTYDCGIVLHGGHGRLPEKNPKHSFRLKFKKEYAGKKTLHYPVFADDPNREHTESEKYDQLVLRCHFGNSWQHWNGSYRERAQYARDLWARLTQKRMGHVAAEGIYVNLFINGLYWGLYNIAERIDSQFCKDHDGGDKSEYDVIKVEETGGDHAEASEGTIDAWNQMISVAATADQDEGYLRLQGLNAQGQKDDALEPLLHIDHFIDYMLLNQYIGNNDWNTHNWYAFRRTGSESTGFHFVSWDAEQIFEGLNDNKLDLNYSENPSGIFQTLIKHPDFMHRYMDRAYELLSPDGLLGPQHAVELWDSLFHTIENAIHLESARWGNYRREVHPWQTRGQRYRYDPYYLNERNRLVNEYFPQRTNVVLNDITRKHWMSKTEAPSFIINGDATLDKDTLTTDDTLILDGPLYTVCTTDGERPVTWVGNAKGTPTATSFVYDQKDLLSRIEADEKGTWVTINAIGMRSAEWSPMVSRRFFVMGEPSGIRDAHLQPIVIDKAVYDLQGRRVASSLHDSSLPAGVYIVNGKKVIKK